MLYTDPAGSSMANILVIEDENDIRELMTLQLGAQGNNVFSVGTGDEALTYIQTPKESIDLFIIDRMLPGVGGIELCRKIRNTPQTAQTPIIMVTALTQSENIIEGLDAGADDYITKPFDMNVLQARVRAQLRKTDRQDNKTSDALQFGNLEVDLQKCKISFEKNEIVLTSTEFKIVSLLAQRPGHVFTRKQIITTIQGDQIFVTNRTIDTHVAGLRKKMGDAAIFIETIRGIGYRFKDNE